MFTTTNVAATTASAGGGGPVAAVVPPTFQLTSAPATGSSSSSASSTTATAWRLTPTSSTTLIKQPSVVSIVNGNMNVLSATAVPLSSTGVSVPTLGSKIYIATTTNSGQHNPTGTGNLILQSPQTVRIVSSPLHTSLSAPTLTLLNNRTPTIINNGRPLVSTSSRIAFSRSLTCQPRPITHLSSFLHIPQHEARLLCGNSDARSPRPHHHPTTTASAAATALKYALSDRSFLVYAYAFRSRSRWQHFSYITNPLTHSSRSKRRL